jgi:catechol 2,3-dioxygenase-like lactoylglutathione lyase family enzyme
MLGAYPLNPILPAQDGPRAEAFYRDVLGLEQISPPGADPMAFRAGNGTTIAVTELPDRQPPDYPTVSFSVSAIERLVDELARRGVSFLE